MKERQRISLVPTYLSIFFASSLIFTGLYNSRPPSLSLTTYILRCISIPWFKYSKFFIADSVSNDIK
eukprot:UN04274